MRCEQFMVQSAASDCTGKEAPVAGIPALVTVDVPAESQWLLIRSSSTEASALSWVRSVLFLMRIHPRPFRRSYDHQNALL